MGLYNLKEFLSFNDIFKYLKDKNFYTGSPVTEDCREEVRELLIELIHNFHLRPVIRYNGAVIKRYYYVDEQENEITLYLSDYKKRVFCSYLIIYRKKAIQLLNDGESVNLKDTKLRDYPFDDERKTENIDCKDKSIDFEVCEDLIINRDSLLYPRYDLDKYFLNKENISPNITQNNEIIRLEKQLEQAHGEIDLLKAELEQAHIEIENFKNMKTKNYITPELQIIDDVIAEFWENHTDDKIPVKKDVIVDWIIEKYNISNNIASAIDSITRPEYARTGGLKALSKRPKD